MGVSGRRPRAVRAVTQEEALLRPPWLSVADHEEASRFEGRHDLLRPHLSAVKRQEGELRVDLLAAEHLHVGDHVQRLVDVGDQFLFAQLVDVLEPADDRRTAAQRPQLATHVRRI